jgi:hypothetical protein
MDYDVIVENGVFTFDESILFSTSPYVFNEIEAIVESECEFTNDMLEKWRLVMRDVIIHGLMKRIHKLENDIQKLKFGNEVYLSLAYSNPNFVKVCDER